MKTFHLLFREVLLVFLWSSIYLHKLHCTRTMPCIYSGSPQNQYVIHTSLGGVDPLTSDNTPSSDPNPDPSSRVHHPCTVLLLVMLYYSLASSLLLSLLCSIIIGLLYVFSISVHVLAMKYKQMTHGKQFLIGTILHCTCSFWGLCLQTPTGALPLDPAGGLPSHRLPALPLHPQ